MASELDTLVSLMSLMNAGRGSAGGNTITTGGGETITEGGGGTSYSEGYSSPGDTTALQALLGELSGADYQSVLQSIFAQAGGKIPGFMNALQNSVGARSGGNSAVQAMLQRLLAETTLQGQAQIADLGLRNANTRAQIGANIAQATKGTHQYQTTVQEANPQRVTRTPTSQVTTPTKQPYGIGEMAGLLGLLSAGKGIWGEMNKSGKGDVTTEASGNTLGTIMSGGAGGIAGGEITSDPWANSAPYLTDNQIFSFTEGPNFLSDTGLQFSNGPSYTDFLSNDTGSFGLSDFSGFDLGSLFDGGQDFVPAFDDYDFTSQEWY